MTDSWFDIPHYPFYEINCEGTVRVRLDHPMEEHRGTIMPVRTFVPDKSKPDVIIESYLLISDEGPRTVRKSVLLKSLED